VNRREHCLDRPTTAQIGNVGDGRCYADSASSRLAPMIWPPWCFDGFQEPDFDDNGWETIITLTIGLRPC
jgi:hypothetical protein